MLRIIPLSDRIAERFIALSQAGDSDRQLSGTQRDRLMVLLATLVDQVCSPDAFRMTCAKLGSEDFGVSSDFLFGPSGERALRAALAEVAWSLLEPEEIELWANLQQMASRAYASQSKYAIAELGSPSNETEGSAEPVSRSTRS